MAEGRATIEAVLHRPGRRFAGYAFGLDGTVCLGEELLPGAREAIEEIRAGGARVIFATNRTSEGAADCAARLTRLGLPTTPDAVLTALDSVRLHLNERHPESRLLVIGEPVVSNAVAAWGWPVVEDPAEAEVVLVSCDRGFDYSKLRRALDAVARHGASILATNPDPVLPAPAGSLPDCGAILASIETAGGVRAEAVLGKPSAAMGRALLDRLGTAPEESAMVGDSLLTDVPMGRREGMTSVLTLGGVTSAAEVVDSELQPDHVVERLDQLLPA